MARNNEVLSMLPHNYSPQLERITEDQLIEREKEKEESGLEKKLDRKSDRRFLWVVTLVSAVVGAAVGSFITIIYEAFFKR